ncbi:MFS transporter [Avibacterium sp. 21-599]|uniref:MFS transporter n=1 Tax=Avibacterium sp. 21-599 TaxID=2911528 RepID=UPI002247E4E3|nr:MFS transporter [Avibacterium sp. 21-599]MCW9718317.1 MFS transporter [Avibacterium sp. 21-599]
MEFALLKKEYRIDLLFFLNSIVSTLPIILVIFFLSNKNITENDISLLFSIKFWGVAIFSCLYFPLCRRLTIKHIIICSFFLRFLAYFYFLFNPTFYGAVILISVTALATALFSTASKIYLQNTSHDIARSLSQRFTLNNIGVAITPFLLNLFGCFNGLVIFSLFIIVMAMCLSFKLRDIQQSAQNNHQENKFALNFTLLSAIFLACMAFSVFI